MAVSAAVAGVGRVLLLLLLLLSLLLLLPARGGAPAGSRAETLKHAFLRARRVGFLNLRASRDLGRVERRDLAPSRRYALPLPVAILAQAWRGAHG